MKTRSVIVVSILLLALLLAGCSSISQEDYNKALSDYQEATEAIESLTEQNESLEAELESLNTDYNKLLADKDILETKYDKVVSEYDDYKSKMSPYENLEQAEAEARQIEADAAIEAARIEAEEIAAAEAAEREEKERQGYDTGITYDQLARTPDEYEGELVKFRGEVLQVTEFDDTIEIRLAVNSDYDDVIFCGYDKSIVSSRVLEGDKITIYGTSIGLITYEAVWGNAITIPAVWIDKIDQ